MVGGVWLYAGWLKIGDPDASTTAVRAYQLLPLDVVDAVGRVLPAVEIGVGLLLVLGLLQRVAGLLSALLLVAFVIGIASVWVRGIPNRLRLLRRGRLRPGRVRAVPLGDRP